MSNILNVSQIRKFALKWKPCIHSSLVSRTLSLSAPRVDTIVVSPCEFHHCKVKKGKLGANATKRVAAGAHLPTPMIFEPAKHPDVRADYCLD